MQGHASAYAALGLRPGADRDEVERAYRRLIKLHHPDRHGGDAGRAAEINRAYSELRRASADAPQVPPRPHHVPQRGGGARPRHRRRIRDRRRRSRNWSVLIIALGGLLLLQAGPLAEDLAVAWRSFQRALDPVIQGTGPGRRDPGEIEEPLSDPIIAAAADRAARLAAARDEDGLADYSRRCHRELRTNPSIAGLDGCLAFDIAAAALANRDQMLDSGRFGPSELTTRQMNAGSLLSADYLAIERRLDAVRSAVELRLLPAAPNESPPPMD